MTAILTALGSGASARKVLEFLMKKSPDLAPKITQALASGLTAEKILGFFSKERNFEKLKQSMEDQYPMHSNANPLVQAENIRGSNLAPDMSSGLQRQLPNIAGTAATLAGSYALSRAIPSILQHGAVAEAISPQTTPIKSQIQTQVNPQQPPISSNVTSVTQSQIPTQPEEISINRDEVNALWRRLSNDVIKHPDKDLSAFLKIANDLQKYSGLKREDFDRLYSEFIEKKQSGIPLNQIAKEIFSSYGKAKVVEQPSQELDRGQETERAPIAKNETVATPHGVGEVREIRNGQAIVDVDGKLHKVKEEELEGSPLPEKELADLYDDLIKGIEGETGEDVSRMVQWAGYNPEENTLTFLPHTGKLYKYSNISSEDAALLRDVLSVRKTSGENFIGAWKAGSKSPIGAALSRLIRKLQSERGGKGNEYEETHEPIYSAYEPAIQAKKKKKKK